MTKQTMKDVLAEAYLTGFRDGMERYAHWKDGQQFVGTCGTRLETARRLAEEDVKPLFSLWLLRKQKSVDGESAGEANAIVGG